MNTVSVFRLYTYVLHFISVYLEHYNLMSAIQGDLTPTKSKEVGAGKNFINIIFQSPKYIDPEETSKS